MYKYAHTILLGVAVMVGSFLALSQFIDQPQELDMQLVYITQSGYYFHEPTAEFEDIILVPHEDMRHPMKVGTWVTGVFDSEGWELQYIKEEPK